MSKIQHYGIKFPFLTVSEEKTLLDTSLSPDDEVRSQLMHVIFTPRGQRLRNPEFGTRLIQFVFNPNEGELWGDVVCEIKDAVSRWVPNCRVDDVFVSVCDNGLGLLTTVKYTVTGEDGSTAQYQLMQKL